MTWGKFLLWMLIVSVILTLWNPGWLCLLVPVWIVFIYVSNLL